MADPAVLQAIRGIVRERYTLFTCGACWALFEALHEVWPASKAWYDPLVGHVYTEINGVLYDAHGALPIRPMYFHPLTRDHRRWISQMRRNAIRSIHAQTASEWACGSPAPPTA